VSRAANAPRCRACAGLGEVYSVEVDPDGSHWIECEECDGYGIEVTAQSRRAYLALSAEAGRVGWPTHYKRDLTYWDRNALDGRDPALPFVWVLRELGTHLVAPTQQRLNPWTGALIGGLSEAIKSGCGMLRTLAREGGHRFYWWNGARLREVSPDDAIELYTEACREGNVAAEDRAASGNCARCGGVL
jgi:hypothetical protein